MSPQQSAHARQLARLRPKPARQRACPMISGPRAGRITHVASGKCPWELCLLLGLCGPLPPGRAWCQIATDPRPIWSTIKHHFGLVTDDSSSSTSRQHTAVAHILTPTDDQSSAAEARRGQAVGDLGWKTGPILSLSIGHFICRSCCRTRLFSLLLFRTARTDHTRKQLVQGSS